MHAAIAPASRLQDPGSKVYSSLRPTSTSLHVVERWLSPAHSTLNWPVMWAASLEGASVGLLIPVCWMHQLTVHHLFDDVYNQLSQHKRDTANPLSIVRQFQEAQTEKTRPSA